MKPKAKGLGRGLDAIFEIEGKPQTVRKATASTMEELAVANIVPNPMQPRTHFDEDALEELADSIKVLGVIQPITVKKEQDGKFTIISGERRWRASQLAGLESIPAFVREATDQNMHEMALVENIQREDLNPMEVALSLQRLIDECDLTQDGLSERVGKKRSTIANYMRLLKLPVEVQSAVREEYITMGHAKAIASAPEPARMGILRKVLKKGLSVRQAEELARNSAQGRPSPSAAEEVEYPDYYGILVERLAGIFSENISIRKDKKGGGKIVIGFETDQDVRRFLSNLNQKDI